MTNSRKINVVHMIGWLGFGGLESGVIKLVNKLDRSCFTPSVVAITGFDEYGRSNLFSDVRFTGLNRKPGRDWSIVRKLADFFSKNKIDLVHSHNWETWLYSYLAARIARVPVFIHGEHGRDTEKIADDWPKVKVKSFLAWQSDQLTTVSQDIADMMTVKWRVKPEKIAVISNGIDLSKYQPPADHKEAKAKLGFSKNDFLVGTVVGCFRPVKDLLTLVQAFAQVKQKHHNSKLAIVGGREKDFTESGNAESYFHQLKQFIHTTGIQDSVYWGGPRNDIESFMQAFDVYVNSSLYEGMSNTILEAMGCGAAIVATKVGGTPLIVRDGHNGLLVPSKSPDEMAAAICRLIETPRFKNILGKSGRKFVEHHHHQELFIEKHQRIYQELYRHNKNS